MPHKPLRQCAVRTCPNLVEKHGDIYCKEHKSLEAKKYDKYLRGYDDSKRYDSRWTKLRNLFIKSFPFCSLCREEGRMTKATVVHHIIPVEEDESLKYSWDNLMSLCQHHHMQIHKNREKSTYKF